MPERSGTVQLRQVFILLAAAALSACGGSSSGGGGTVNVTADTLDPSVARQWNEVLLEAIRGDFARPTVHARNLFHVSAAMYDAWSAYDDVAAPWLLGDSQAGYDCDLDAFPMPADIHPAREEAISHAAYRLITYRFRLSPGVLDTEDLANELMAELGFDEDDTSVDYSDGSPAALGNYIAQCYINYGLMDGSNEQGFFANEFYEPVNPPIRPARDGNPSIEDLDRWQPISLPLFIDQSGNPVGSNPEFLSPEWGQVDSFALDGAPLSIFQRDGFDYYVYYPDIAVPPPTAQGTLSDLYKWGFALVSVWSSHLDQSDNIYVDISANSLGSPDNASGDPASGPLDNYGSSYYPPVGSFDEYSDFYNLLDGGDPSTGYDVNPATGEPYEPQFVPRGDYARVLAEFWADGPDSETPPGHWYVILNEEVNDSPDFEKRFENTGPVLGPLEWDVKIYFALGGTMHDAAIAAWGIKGWYDYLRPVSAIRAMADRGQSTDSGAASYSPDGIPLVQGKIELIEAGDPLEGSSGQHIGKIKVKAWKGPDFIDDPETDQAGVDWIRAENWWPYQRPTFVSPPFAGYVSGHSTYSRAAAELLTAFTGDPYFPGGRSGFEVKANEFLVFEEGPSVDMTLEWATYRDASDQCSLSRIWGGIHPPADDIPGRQIGMQLGPRGFARAKAHFEGNP